VVLDGQHRMHPVPPGRQRNRRRRRGMGGGIVEQVAEDAADRQRVDPLRQRPSSLDGDRMVGVRQHRGLTASAASPVTSTSDHRAKRAWPRSRRQRPAAGRGAAAGAHPAGVPSPAAPAAGRQTAPGRAAGWCQGAKQVGQEAAGLPAHPPLQRQQVPLGEGGLERVAVDAQPLWRPAAVRPVSAQARSGSPGERTRKRRTTLWQSRATRRRAVYWTAEPRHDRDPEPGQRPQSSVVSVTRVRVARCCLYHRGPTSGTQPLSETAGSASPSSKPRARTTASGCTPRSATCLPWDGNANTPLTTHYHRPWPHQHRVRLTGGKSIGG
jgi:hypothetical protein